MRFELKQLNETIFLLTFDNSYDLSIHFLRWSEYTESDDPNIANKFFNILDFIESYSKKNGNVFTYPEDWAGFNISSDIFEKFDKSKIKDYNKYDEFMLNLIKFIKIVAEGEQFCIIGAVTGDTNTIEHEISHALYYTVPQYKKEMLDIICNIKLEHVKFLSETIKEMGYNLDVFEDELQAYCSTGLSEELQKCFRVKRIPKNILKDFRKVFKKHKDALINNE